jgi:hypothetical protein
MTRPLIDNLGKLCKTLRKINRLLPLIIIIEQLYATAFVEISVFGGGNGLSCVRARFSKTRETRSWFYAVLIEGAVEAGLLLLLLQAANATGKNRDAKCTLEFLRTKLLCSMRNVHSYIIVAHHTTPNSV